MQDRTYDRISFALHHSLQHDLRNGSSGWMRSLEANRVPNRFAEYKGLRSMVLWRSSETRRLDFLTAPSPIRELQGPLEDLIALYLAYKLTRGNGVRSRG